MAYINNYKLIKIIIRYNFSRHTMTNTWSAKTALSDQEKDCLSNIYTLFQKKPEAADEGVPKTAEENKEQVVEKAA